MQLRNKKLQGFMYLANSKFRLDYLTQETTEKELKIYRTLWRAALNQVFLDAFSNSKKRRNFKVKRLAKAFVNLQNPNFIFMCELACYDPSRVISYFKTLERQGYKLGNDLKEFI